MPTNEIVAKSMLNGKKAHPLIDTKKKKYTFRFYLVNNLYC